MALPTNQSAGGTGGPDLGPDPQIDPLHDGAPGGLSIANDLPCVSVPGGKPMTTNGYAPSAEQDSLPAPGSSEGFTRPPAD